jgi:hypothetical protein
MTGSAAIPTLIYFFERLIALWAKQDTWRDKRFNQSFPDKLLAHIALAFPKTQNALFAG